MNFFLFEYEGPEVDLILNPNIIPDYLYIYIYK